MTGVGECHRNPAGVTRPRILILRAGVPAGQHGAIRPDGQPQLEQGPAGHGPLRRGGTGDKPGPQPVAVGPFGGRDASRLGPGQRGRPSRRRVDSPGRAQDAGVRLELAAQLGRNQQRQLRLTWVLRDAGDREPRLSRRPGRRDGPGGRQHQGGADRDGPPPGDAVAAHGRSTSMASGRLAGLQSCGASPPDRGTRRMIGSSRSVFCWYPAKRGAEALICCQASARSVP